MKSKGKMVSLGYFILFDGFNELEYHTLLMNLEESFFYSIFVFLEFMNMGMTEIRNEISTLTPYSSIPNTP